MKKILFVLLAILATVVTAQAAKVSVAFTNGQTMEGTLISMSDTAITLVPSNALDHKEVLVMPSRVKNFFISGIGRYIVVDGKFVPTAQTQAKLDKMQEQAIMTAADPNQVIARAFKTTGDVCLSIGIPSAVLGTILVAYGYSDTNTSAANAAETMIKKSQCAAAGFVFLPMGAALTIVGVPLHLHGKKIGQLNVNYTGNGAGMSFNF